MRLTNRLAFAALLLPEWAWGQTVAPLDLKTAVGTSILSNPGVLAATARWEQARGRIQEAKSALKPQATVGAGATLFDEPHVFDFGQLTGGGRLPVTILERWNPALYAQVMLPIDLTGTIKAAASQAQFAEIAARTEVEAARNRAALQAKTAYFSALRATAARQNAEASLDLAQKRLDALKRYEQAGVVANFDVLSAARDVSAAEQAVVGARATEERAIVALNRAMGIDPLTQHELVTGPGELKAPAELKALLAEAYEKRPELKAGEALVQAAKKGIVVAGRNLAPQLVVGAGANYQPNAGPFSPDEQHSLSISLSFPLLDGGLASARRQQAKSDLDLAELNVKTTRDQVTDEVHGAALRVTTTQERLNLAEAELQQAEEAYRLAQARFEVGVTRSSVVSPQVELRGAEVALTQARIARSDARLDAEIAKAELEYALGRSS